MNGSSVAVGQNRVQSSANQVPADVSVNVNFPQPVYLHGLNQRSLIHLDVEEPPPRYSRLRPPRLDRNIYTVFSPLAGFSAGMTLTAAIGNEEIKYKVIHGSLSFASFVLALSTSYLGMERRG